jgi:hypothetical protein
MLGFKSQSGQLWLKFMLLLGLSGAVTQEAAADCRLVIKGLNYQALECDSYVPLVTETSALIDIAKRTINNPGCIDKLAAFAKNSVGCTAELYYMAVALTEGYAALEASAAAGTLLSLDGDAYLIVMQTKGVLEEANLCKDAYKDFAKWSEDRNCSGVGKRPQLPPKYQNAKPARLTYSSGLSYLEPLDGSRKLPFDGRFYNAQTNKCDVYSQGRLVTSTLFYLCEEFKMGERFHWSIPDRTCTHLSYGTDLGRVQNYRCGTQYETNEITYKTATGSCYRAVGKFMTYLNDSSCSGLAPAADAYLWQNNRCELYRNGRFTTFVDKTQCGRAESFRYEFSVGVSDVGVCRRVKENGLSDIVPNSNCGQPSRYIVKGLASCTVSVDGQYQKLLFDGQEDCILSSTTPAPIETLPENPCLDPTSDGDGDGWGWENGAWCNSRLTPSAPVPLPPLTCFSASSDPDGDGWGWENGASCQVAPSAPSTSSGYDISVQAPGRISASGLFSVTVTSRMQRSVLAELWLKEEGGNWSPYAEAQFYMSPGENIPAAMIHTFPDASKRYRIEVRVIENNSSIEVFAQPVSIQY